MYFYGRNDAQPTHRADLEFSHTTIALYLDVRSH
jgi:hypothetical protein